MILFYFSYDVVKVSKRLPFIFVAIWCFCIGAQVHLVFATVLMNNKCIIGYTLWTTFWFDVEGYYAIVLSFGIPSTIMITCYTRMFLLLNNSRQMFNSKESFSETSEHKLRLAQMNIFKTCVIIVIVYIASFSTGQSAKLLFLLGYYKQIGTHGHMGNVFMTFNSFINPVVYAMQYHDFKVRLKLLLKL